MTPSSRNLTLVSKGLSLKLILGVVYFSPQRRRDAKDFEKLFPLRMSTWNYDWAHKGRAGAKYSLVQHFPVEISLSHCVFAVNFFDFMDKH